MLQVAICYTNTIENGLRRPDPISCHKWDVSYFTTLKKKKSIFMLHMLQFIPTIH